MEFIQYLLVLIVLLIGSIAGIIISYKAKEEMKTGRRFFLIAQPLLLLAAVIVTVWRSSLSFGVALIIVFISAFLIHKEVYNYMLLAAILSFAVPVPDIFIIVAAITLVYLLLSSSLIYFHSMSKKKPSAFIAKACMIKYVLFLVVGIIGYFL